MPAALNRPVIARQPPPVRRAAAQLQRPVLARRVAPGLAAPVAIRRPGPRVASRKQPRPSILPLPVTAPTQTLPVAAWQGPNPYGDFARSFTAEGGIKLTFKVKDLRAWRTWLRVALWAAAMAATLWFALRASPYPFVPRGCPLFGPCPASVPGPQVAINLGLLLAMALVYAWILFVEDQMLASIEIRPDCMIVDEADLFWRQHMDLGWPQIEPDLNRGFVLRGVYGTREVDYLTLHAFDEQDRSVQVLGAHLQRAMQQLWEQPGGGS